MRFLKNYHRRKIFLTPRLMNFRGGGACGVKWVELTGHDGISNDIHMMITVHINPIRRLFLYK
jgi:hypothetical protein